MHSELYAAYNKQSTLVLGGNGFIGGHLVQALQRLNADVLVLNRSLLDLNEQQAVKDFFAGHSFDYIFNCAGYVDHTPLASGGDAVISAHYNGLLNIVSTMNGVRLKGFVQIGSSDEYGLANAPQHESLREQPISPYACAKTAATHLMQMLARTQGLPIVVARLFLVYGPAQNQQRFLPQVITGCLRNTSFAVSQGGQKRDFCYIDDVVEGLLLAAIKPQAHGEVVNIASGQPITIRAVIDEVVRQIGTGHPEMGKIAYRKNENMALYADVTKAKKILNWCAKVPLIDGLARTIAAFALTI